MAYRNESRSLLIVALGGKVNGIDRRTGKIVWTDGLIGGGTGVVEIAIVDDFVLASAHAAELFCFEYATGFQRWKVGTSEGGRASFVVEPDAIYVARSGVIDCFTYQGKRLWSQPLKGMGRGRISFGFEGNIRQADAEGSGD